MKGIYVTGVGSISALGVSSHAALEAYASGASGIRVWSLGARALPLGRLPDDAEALLVDLAKSTPRGRVLDRSVKLALVAAREASARARFAERDLPFATILGSSRGATSTLEASHQHFLRTGKVQSSTSPTTTLGNLASNVARDAGRSSLAAEVSSACSTAHHAVLFGVALLRSRFVKACLVGGAEAPITTFTVAQFDALGLLGSATEAPSAEDYRPLAREPRNRLVLGEGACVLALERLTRRQAEQRRALAELVAFGSSMEQAPSPTGVSADGRGFEAAMRSALVEFGEGVDAVIPHAPGTRKGDEAELAALRRVFGEPLPPLHSSKWQMGHCFGAASAFGIELGLALLGGVRPPAPPYPSYLGEPLDAPNSVMINSAGFGGTFSSIILKRVKAGSNSQ